MNRRELLATAAFASTALSAASSSKVLRNMGSAGPGLRARIQAEGKNWDIVEYCHQKGLGAAHTTLPADLNPAGVAKLRQQIDKYDMRLTVGVRVPRTETDRIVLEILAVDQGPRNTTAISEVGLAEAD